MKGTLITAAVAVVVVVVGLPVGCSALMNAGYAHARGEAVAQARGYAHETLQKITDNLEVSGKTPSQLEESVADFLPHTELVTKRADNAGYEVVQRITTVWYQLTQQHRIFLCVAYTGASTSGPHLEDRTCPEDRSIDPSLDEFVKLGG